MTFGEILLTEDNEDLRKVSEEILSLSGFKVRALSSGRDALNLLRSGFRPACFLLDLGLPDITPEEFYEEFSSIPNSAQIPLVLASGRHDLPIWGEKMGAVRVMRKPYDFDALLNLAEKYCGAPSDLAAGGP